tara:strand:+ start:5941 stop:6837 length:897 start_codon:yes stop_codon:yes gene_type:complete
MSLSISNLPYGDRRPDTFIDTMVKSAGVLNRFRLVDGVKNKVNVPIFDAALTFGTDICAWDPQSTATIGEKEMSVDTYKWSFLNCKDALESSYRGLMLKKGQHNAETMDAEFKDWVFDYFAKLSAQKALELAATKLVTELDADANIIALDTNVATIAKANVLGLLEASYEAMSATMLSAIFGDADRAYRPAFFMGTAAYQAYQLAIADKFTMTPQGLIEGSIPQYLGMEIIHFASMAANEVIVSAPDNIVMLTDDYNDVKAIDMKYEAELSSDKVWGQFKIGFSYLKSEEIVYGKDRA